MQAASGADFHLLKPRAEASGQAVPLVPRYHRRVRTPDASPANKRRVSTPRVSGRILTGAESAVDVDDLAGHEG